MGFRTNFSSTASCDRLDRERQWGRERRLLIVQVTYPIVPSIFLKLLSSLVRADLLLSSNAIFSSLFPVVCRLLFVRATITIHAVWFFFFSCQCYVPRSLLCPHAINYMLSLTVSLLILAGLCGTVGCHGRMTSTLSREPNVTT